MVKIFAEIFFASAASRSKRTFIVYHVINSDGWGSRYRFTASRFSTTVK